MGRRSGKLRGEPYRTDGLTVSPVVGLLLRLWFLLGGRFFRDERVGQSGKGWVDDQFLEGAGRQAQIAEDGTVGGEFLAGEVKSVHVEYGAVEEAGAGTGTPGRRGPTEVDEYRIRKRDPRPENTR